MTAVIFSFVVGISLGMGVGVCGTLWILWKRGVLSSQTLPYFTIDEAYEEFVTKRKADVNDFKPGGSE